MKVTETHLPEQRQGIMSRHCLEKFLPWYLFSCGLPFLPYVLSLIIPHRNWNDIWFWASLLVLAGLAVAFNLLMGGLLLWNLRGPKRVYVALAFAFGAVFPLIVIIASYNYAPIPPVEALG
ncbi:hypothetical protein [Aliiroseovarius sp. PrR006]|uniref:hypothetical protein n=1 Tax=Aliiroseovarius sp. PrR006 TaxID=2706883 RepID=UPI0013CF4E3A|nr:hypothetical protein [Aliiroseovarius sp. PrR006]NDW53894.1 hypothetical protein [Aliiroseovarius sp. PrR006]